MSGNPLPRCASPSNSLRTLEILRLKSQTSATVILTSPSYGGVLTHYVKRTEICMGEACRECRHNARLYYRGYGAALKFDQASKKWLPIVLELTERLEHDFNGLWTRGQVWEITKDRDTRETHGKVTGELKNQLDQAMVPPPIDIDVPLRTLFRVQEIPWGAINSVPKAVAVALVEIDARADPKLRPEPEPKRPEADPRLAKELFEELAKRARMPAPSANGKAH